MAGRRFRRISVFWVLGLALIGCGSPSPLAETHGSSFQLAQAVVDAVARNDRAALEQLALSEREFRDHVWPELPAARPERNLPFSYVWSDLRQKSEASLSKTLAEHGGRRYALLGVEFDGVTDYGTYRVHREAAFRVRDTAGQEMTLRLCGSLIEQSGAWKVFSYVVD